jgi:outer membrane protein assembly factor BamB
VIDTNGGFPMLTTFLLLGSALFAVAAAAEDDGWRWKDDEATVGHSVLADRSEYDLTLGKKAGEREVTVAFAKDGKTRYTLAGHGHTVFRVVGDTLVFARFSPGASGAQVVAVDLITGKELWATDLKGLGPVEHSAYRNRLNLDATADTVIVFGYESQGRYVENLNTKTGKTTSHHVFPRAAK